ncbi:hypothetical protein PHYNN_75 [Pantoea phage Phynn]|nr:hypothetical protein PHYNN_75 [Pantoea phage Phynn]
MSEISKDEMKTMKRWGVAILVAAVGAFIYNGCVENEKAAQREVEKEKSAIAAYEQEKIIQMRRDTGFTEIRETVNAFGEVVSKDYSVMSKEPGVYMMITTDATGSVEQICFSAYTNDPDKRLFHPSFRNTVVPVKFDRGDTKEFYMGDKSGLLCVVSTERFLYNMKTSKVMHVAIPYLDKYTHVSEVAEFNLKMYQEISR